MIYSLLLLGPYLKKHEIKSNTRENDAIQKQGKCELYEAAAGVTQGTSS
jgi:hypothetical protein